MSKTSGVEAKKAVGSIVRSFERAWFWNRRRGERYEFRGGASEMTYDRAAKAGGSWARSRAVTMTL
jgi:hypothetical protein